MTNPLYRYACQAREAMLQHAAKSRSALTPSQLAERRLAAQRLVGRPVVPEKDKT